MSDETQPSGKVNETALLRNSWNAAAAQMIGKLNEKKPVRPGEVESMQRALENIEARELFEQARDLTKG